MSWEKKAEKIAEIEETQEQIDREFSLKNEN